MKPISARKGSPVQNQDHPSLCLQPLKRLRPRARKAPRTGASSPSAYVTMKRSFETADSGRGRTIGRPKLSVQSTENQLRSHTFACLPCALGVAPCCTPAHICACLCVRVCACLCVSICVCCVRDADMVILCQNGVSTGTQKQKLALFKQLLPCRVPPAVRDSGRPLFNDVGSTLDEGPRRRRRQAPGDGVGSMSHCWITWDAADPPARPAPLDLLERCEHSWREGERGEERGGRRRRCGRGTLPFNQWLHATATSVTQECARSAPRLARPLEAQAESLPSVIRGTGTTISSAGRSCVPLRHTLTHFHDYLVVNEPLERALCW